MDMTVVRNLAHNIIDDEFALSIFGAANQAERLYHESSFSLSRCLAMLPKDRHRSIARIAIEQCEPERQGETRVPRSVFFQFAQIAFGHNRKDLAIRCVFGKIGAVW